MKRTVCHHCNGTGEEPDQHATGNRIRGLRVTKGVQAKDLAKKLGISPAFYSDLELGRRAWSSMRIRECERILNEK